MSLVKSTLTIGGYTLISRVFGFIRDMMIAAFLGASDQTDAFFVAFKLPNFFRRIFAEGAFNSAFVPLYAGMLAAEGRPRASQFASRIFAALLFVLLIVTAVFTLIMPWFMHILAPGFAEDPAKFNLTITLTRITFPYLLFISLVSLLGGILNSIDKFGAVAATPILMNLCFILALPIFSPFTPTPAHALAIGVFIAGVVQFVWLVWFCRKYDIMPKLGWPRFDEDVKKLLVLIGPAALGASVAQINLMVDMIIGSHIPQAVSYLYYADRVNELPLAVIGIAIGTALLPMLSRQRREGNHAAALHSQNRAIELTLLLSLPATLALMVIAQPVIQVLFEHGAFGPAQTAAVKGALIAFAAGLPAFVLIKVLAPGFFSNHDTKTPFIIATICVVLNLVLNLLLMGPLQHVGMALATTIAGWVNAGAMAVVLYRRGLFRPDAVLLARLPRIVLASLAMAAALWGAMLFSAPAFEAKLLWQALALSGLVAGGLLVFGLTALAIGAADPAYLKTYLSRRR